MPETATTSHPVWFNGIRLTPEPDARQNFIVCDDPITPNMKDGWHQENTKFLRLALGHAVTLPQYSFVAHQKKADKTLPKPDEESWRGGKTIEISDKKPTFIIDADGIVGGLVIPMYFKGDSLTHMSLYATTLAQLELAKAMEKVRKNLNPGTSVSWHEQGEDRYLVMDGIFGELHFCKAWHAQGHQHSDHFAPSRELMGSKSNIELANRFLYIDALQAAAFRTNDLVAQAFPALSTLLRSASKPLREDPIIRAVDNIWHSDFFGQALLMNKQSGEHLDVNGVCRAWDILYATGDFHGGELFLKDMNVRIPFKPGTLVAFDGTAQRHAIQPFEGPQRISSVFFVHQSVFHELGIDSTLPDLTTTMVMNSLARQKNASAAGGVAAAAILRTFGQPSIPAGFRLGDSDDHSVLDAELAGILLATHLVLSSEVVDDATIFTDSQEAISCITGKAEGATQALLKATWRALKRARDRAGGTTVRLQWCPGHVGIPGNEEADAEAGAAMRGKVYPAALVPLALRNYRPPTNPTTLKRKLQRRNRDAATAHWLASKPGARFSSRFPSIAASDFLAHTHGLPRSRATLLFRLTTGHVQLRRHLHRLQVENSPCCAHCGNQDETVAHFLLHCPRYALERHLCLEVQGHEFARLDFLLFSSEALGPLFEYVKATGRFSDLLR